MLKRLFKIPIRMVQWVFFFVTGRGPILDEAIQEKIVDLRGQSSDEL